MTADNIKAFFDGVKILTRPFVTASFAVSAIYFTYLGMIEIEWFVGMAVIAIGWWYRDRTVEKKAVTVTKEAAG